MRSYIVRAVEKDKDGVLAKAPPFMYIDAVTPLDGKPRWSSDTPGILSPIS